MYMLVYLFIPQVLLSILLDETNTKHQETVACLEATMPPTKYTS